MALTSLGIASHGLLDRGGAPTLHMASMGLLRIGEGAVELPVSRGGSPGGRVRTIKPYQEPKTTPAVDVIEDEDELLLQAAAIMLMELL